MLYKWFNGYKGLLLLILKLDFFNEIGIDYLIYLNCFFGDRLSDEVSLL